MAAQTGSTYISGTMTDSVEIPTANPGFSAMKSPTKVPPNDRDNWQCATENNTVILYRSRLQYNSIVSVAHCQCSCIYAMVLLRV